MTLTTDLKHVASADELKKLIASSENVMVCCGRMGPMCIPVYGVMSELERSGKFDHVEFRDMAFDSPESDYIRQLPECRSFRGLPYTVYFKNGKVASATSSIQSKQQVVDILTKVF